MRNPGGYAFVTEAGRVVKERDTFTCAHCNRCVFVQPGTPASDCGGFCRQCMKLLCGGCADKGVCTPFEKELEKEEARFRFLKSAGLLEQGKPVDG